MFHKETTEMHFFALPYSSLHQFRSYWRFYTLMRAGSLLRYALHLSDFTYKFKGWHFYLVGCFKGCVILHVKQIICYYASSQTMLQSPLISCRCPMQIAISDALSVICRPIFTKPLCASSLSHPVYPDPKTQRLNRLRRLAIAPLVVPVTKKQHHIWKPSPDLIVDQIEFPYQIF